MVFNDDGRAEYPTLLLSGATSRLYVSSALKLSLPVACPSN